MQRCGSYQYEVMKTCRILQACLLKLLPGRIERCCREARWVGYGPVASTLRIMTVNKDPTFICSGFLGFPATIQMTGRRMNAHGDQDEDTSEMSTIWLMPVSDSPPHLTTAIAAGPVKGSFFRNPVVSSQSLAEPVKHPHWKALHPIVE